MVTKTENELALRYLPLAYAMARDVTSIPSEDARQDAAIGLLIAAAKFDQERGVDFSTYARYWVAESLQKAAIRGLPVHVPVNAAKAGYAKRRSARRGGDAPSASRVVDETDVSAVAIEREDGTLIDGLPVHDDRESIDSALDAGRVVSMLESLPSRQREALTRYYFGDGMSLDAVGAEMGISQEAVRQCIQRGIAGIRRRLGLCLEPAQ
jgi:RNA polymerase sigma factor (sigma-70 family)